MLSLSKVAAAVSLLSTTAMGSSSGAFFQSKTVIIPHDDKKHRGGEDAADSSDKVLAVADGVGGWANQGINPGLFSTLLTKSLIEKSEKDPSLSTAELIADGCRVAAKAY